jgi:hypothetical protein
MALVGTHRVPYPRTPKAFGFPKSFPKNHSPFFHSALSKHSNKPPGRQNVDI